MQTPAQRLIQYAAVRGSDEYSACLCSRESNTLQLVYQRTGESATRMILMGLNSIIDREVVYKDDTPNRGDFAICCENPCNRYRRS
jgi:hypothetical protein